MNKQYVLARLRMVLFHIDNAIKFLRNAEGYSILDIFTPFGLSIIPDMFEYDAYYKAMHEINIAFMILNEVRYYLKNIYIGYPYMDNTPLWMMFDIGFDNLIFDLLRHMRIREVRKNIEKLREKIIDIIRRIETNQIH